MTVWAKNGTIADADLAKLRQSNAFTLEQLKSLQREVFFKHCPSFCTTRSRKFAMYEKDSLSFEKDDTGIEYVEKTYNEGKKIILV